MAVAFYILGSLLISGGGLWFLVEALTALQPGRVLPLVSIALAAAYVMLAGALFVALGAIIQRLDIMVANTRGRARPNMAVPITDRGARRPKEGPRTRWE